MPGVVAEVKYDAVPPLSYIQDQRNWGKMSDHTRPALLGILSLSMGFILLSPFP